MKQTLRMLIADLRNGCGLGLLVAILGIPFLILMDSSADLPDLLMENELSVHYFFFNSISFGGLFGKYLVNMLCALPYASAFIQEREMGIAPLVVARCDASTYFLSKYCACILLGGAANFLGQMVLFCGLSAFLPLFAHDTFTRMAGFYYLGIAQQTPVAYIFIALYYALLSGMLYAGVAMWASGFIASRYVVYIVPVIFNFTHIQMNRIFSIPVAWQTNQWLSMRSCIGSEWTTMCAALLFVSLTLLLCGYSFERRGKRVINLA